MVRRGARCGDGVTTAVGPGFCGDPFGQPLDGPVLPISAGDAISLPITWWQVQPIYGPDGITIVTAGVPVNMNGMTPSAEFLSYGQAPWGGTALTMTDFVPAAGTFLLTGPGHKQPGDLTSGLPVGPPKPSGPRIRVSYTDAAGGSHTLGTFYLSVK